MKSTVVLVWVSFLSFASCLLAAGPRVDHVRMYPRDNSRLVDIWYDLSDADSASVSVSAAVLVDAAFISASTFSGDGYGSVRPAPNRHIVWNAGADWNNQSSTTARAWVTAQDEPEMPPVDMVLVPGGPFAMGDAIPEKEDFYERPVHDTTLTAFWMDRYEVTRTLWKQVFDWAGTNGYTFQWSQTPEVSQKPVGDIQWLDAIRWCNARSELAGLTPVYTLNAQTYRSGSHDDGPSIVCSWNASGYRLPTEAEWEKACRGGIEGRRFHWGDTITHDNANYYSFGSWNYDRGPPGRDPFWKTTDAPFVATVGYYPANPLGLHDMAGNVWEWCWDWDDPVYYSANPQVDPRGGSKDPAIGRRELRGGAAGADADRLRCAARTGAETTQVSAPDVGFRTVRRCGAVYTAHSRDTVLSTQGRARPIVQDISAPICDGIRPGLAMPGAANPMTFTATILWNGNPPGHLRIVTPNGSHTTTGNTFDLDVGALTPGARIVATAVSGDGRPSDPYPVNLSIAPTPFGAAAAHARAPQPTVYDLDPLTLRLFDVGLAELDSPDFPYADGQPFTLGLDARLDDATIANGVLTDTTPVATNAAMRFAGHVIAPSLTTTLAALFDPARQAWSGRLAPRLSLPSPVDLGNLRITGSSTNDMRLMGYPAAPTQPVALDWPHGADGPGVAVSNLVCEIALRGTRAARLSQMHDIDATLEGKASIAAAFRPSGTITQIVAVTAKAAASEVVMRWVVSSNTLNAAHSTTGTLEAASEQASDDRPGDGAAPREDAEWSCFYRHPTPALAANSTAAVMLWLDDNTSRTNTANRSRVLCARQAANAPYSWTTPFGIAEDGTADFAPEVHLLDDGTIVAAWQNLSRALTTNDTLSTALGICEIAVGATTNVGNTFACANLTANNVLDRTPRLAGAGSGPILLTWIRNDAQNILGTAAAPNAILFSIRTGTTWSTPATAGSGLGCIPWYDIAFDGTSGALVYTLDADGDLVTRADRDLYLLTYTNGAWSAPAQLTNDAVEDDHPVLATAGGGSPAMVWRRDGAIVGATSPQAPTTTVIVAASAIALPSDFDAAFVGTTGIVAWCDGFLDTPFLTYWNGGTTPPNHALPVSGAANAVDRAPSVAIVPGIRLLLGRAVNYRNTAQNPDALQGGSVACDEFRWASDLAVVPNTIALAPPDAGPGDSATLSATIRNDGILPAAGATATFHIGTAFKPLLPQFNHLRIGSVSLGATLNPGHTWTASVPWSITNNLAISNVNANVADPVLGNNDFSTTPFRPNLALEALPVVAVGSSNRLLGVTVTNTGRFATPATTVDISLASPSGSSMIANLAVTSLEPGGDVTCSHVWALAPTTLVNAAELIVFTVNPSATFEESSRADNTAFASMSTLRDNDADGIEDARERRYGADPGAMDTDGDGIPDGIEIAAGSAPGSADSDGDGASDGDEQAARTDWWDSADYLHIRTLALSNTAPRLVWDARAGLTYRVMRGTNMTHWTNAPTGAAPDQQGTRATPIDTTLDYRDPAPLPPGSPRFYRLELLP